MSSSELRHRASKEQGSKQDAENSEAENLRKECAEKTSGKTSWLLGAFIIAAGLSWFGPSLKASFSSGRVADGSYAICSQEGDNVYTVDPHDSRTQCVVIRDKIVVTLGSLGLSCEAS